MSEDSLPSLVPNQHEGGKTDAGTVVKKQTAEEARQLFSIAKERMLDVNNWHKYSGPGSATFQLTDSKGKELESKPEKGNLMRVDLPGPGSFTGDGFDWVEIEAFEEEKIHNKDYESFSMRVRPCSNPKTKSDKTAHFYTSAATSTFTLQRIKNTVAAGEHGRNEVPNTNPDNIVDKARNAIVGTSAMSGVSNIQWKALANGLLKED
jgi:hypothetical protein